MNPSVLLLTDEMNPGGVARHVTDLANGLAENGMAPIVAANDGPFRSRLLKQIDFISLPLYDAKNGRKSFFGLPASYKILSRIIRREKVILVHSHKRYTDVLGRALARRMAITHISTCHNTFDSLKSFSVFGDVTIACSKAVEEMLVKDFKKNPRAVTQIYSGIKPLRVFREDEKSRVLKELHIPAGRKIIGSVGQLIESKDRATLVRAIGILKRRGAIDNVLFVILGDGEQKAMLEDLVNNEAVQEFVRFLPGRHDVEAVFNAADFMVLSSMREGLPYVLMEAASIAKPHIATNVGGVSEFVIDGETGILVPSNDPEKIAVEIDNLLTNPGEVERLGMEARKKFIQEFAYDRFINQTMEVYKAYSPGDSHAV